jgi:PiT family inorganic phosphate transporter
MCGINRETCLCLDGKEEVVKVMPNGVAILMSSGLALTVDQIAHCQTKYQGTIVGLRAQDVLSHLHYFTAGTVSFARGLNDTPKIVALFATAQLFEIKYRILFVGIAIAMGGLLNARKVAQTMSKKITDMNHGQGFTANLVSAFLVILASVFNWPVSTTHVTCGSLFGIGVVNGKANWAVIRNILLSWIITLPLAGFFSAAIFNLVR